MKLHRKRLGLSQAALAERAGTAPNYIALIEVGKNFPSLPILEKIAAALEIDALDLFDKTGLITIDKKSLEKMFEYYTSKGCTVNKLSEVI